MSIFSDIGERVEGHSVEEATQLAGLDWTVSKRPVMIQNDDGTFEQSSRFFGIQRDDNKNILGVVGRNYQPVQNYELGYLCDRLSSHAVIENAGMLFGGARVWYQLRGDPFGVGPNKDEVKPYCLFTNGHDGMNPLSALPVSFRVICENTLNMAFSQARRSNTIIRVRHTGDMQDRLEGMIRSIEEFQERTVMFKERSNSLGFTPVDTTKVQQFWTDVYVNMFGDIHTNVETKQHEDDNKRAASVMTKWADVFDLEVKQSGANMWTAYNAVSHWLDHQQTYRGNNKAHNRFDDLLFGDGSKEKLRVFNHALSVAN